LLLKRMAKTSLWIGKLPAFLPKPWRWYCTYVVDIWLVISMILLLVGSANYFPTIPRQKPQQQSLSQKCLGLYSIVTTH
jgi:hypothetical protein